MTKILVADDEPMLLRILTRILERAGFSCLAAEDGERAVELYKSCPAEIDLALLDLNMPRLDGIGAAKAIWQVDSEARILIASGEASGDLTELFEAQQPAGFLYKPFRPDQLLEKVQEQLA